MPLCFRKVHYQAGDLCLDIDLEFHNGLIAGLTGPNRSGKRTLLRLAAGSLQPDSGVIDGFRSVGFAEATVASADSEEITGSIESALCAEPEVLLVGPSFVLTDPACQDLLLSRFHALRRRGGVVVLVSHDLKLLERHCDEAVVMERGRVESRGDPRQILEQYRSRLIDKVRQSAPRAPLAPFSRHGDRRARVSSVEILGRDGRPTSVVHSGETICVAVEIEFHNRVENPVVGMLIRNRIGVNVYGTNTELEGVKTGPCEAGERIALRFVFACNLCAEQYTLTVASHDPDGRAHEWLEEAIVFTVADTRYTTGVANLHARVEVTR